MNDIKKTDPTYITNKTLIFRIVLITLIVSVLILFVSSEYLKKTAVNTLAGDDAKKTAQLVFETMNTRMQEGWTKQDLDTIIDRLEIVRKGMNIASYRSTQVEEIFGIVPDDKKIVDSDPLIQKAMKGEEVFYVDEKTGIVRFLYPMKTSTECNHCHVNASKGSINGVLDISFPHSDIKISLDTISFYTIAFFILFLLILSYMFYTIVNKKMVKPIVLLTKDIQNIEKNKDLTQKVSISTNIEELNILQNSFNVLISTIKYYYDQLIEKLYIDQLTSAYNLTKLQEDIQKLPKDNNYSLLTIDIKSFGMINRVYGNKVADILLQQFVKNTQEVLKDEGKLYRLYGDEFAVVYYSIITKKKIGTLLQLIKEKKYSYKDRDFLIDMTIGFTNDCLDEHSLEKANIALKYAKTNKLNTYEYNDKLAVKDEDSNHIFWLEKLETAILSDKIVPFFMPMKNTKTGQIDKYETLVRIIENDTVYTPDKFIDISIASGKYPLITQTVIKKTFEYFKDIDNIQFSINFALRDIVNQETTDLLFHHLENYKHSQNVIIELLETEEISDFKLLNTFIKNSKKYGVKIAIDDFGSGYSNFNYILNLDIDIVKLDSSLIENIFTDQHSLVVVSNIVHTAKQLGLQVVAEKVSDSKIENILMMHEVDYLQGYHIGKPQPGIL